jgi:hypothetical protein
MATSQTTIMPHNQQPLANSTRIYPPRSEIDALICRAAVAQKAWSCVPLQDRVAIGYKFMVLSNSNYCFFLFDLGHLG